jgi:hypothetical protein
MLEIQWNRGWFAAKCCLGLGWLVLLLGCQPADPPQPPSSQPSAASANRLRIDFDPLLEQPELQHPPQFTEVAQELGVSFQYFNDAREKRYFFPEILGGGFACLDFDLDGWPDLYCANGRALPLNLEDDQNSDRLLRNLSGQLLRDVTDLAYVWQGGYSHGCAYGDLNADGFDDIAIACYGAIVVFLNQGDGTFRQLEAARYPYEATWSVCPIICDVDQDNLPDLLVVNYVRWNYEVPACTYNNIRGYCGPGEFDAVRDYVFLNQGDGNLLESGEALGFTSLGKGLAVAALDWNHDLQPEIYIANDLVANFLYERTADQPVPYREVGVSRGVAVCVNGSHEASMSVTPGDFAMNGWTDIFVTNYYKQKNTLYSNLGEGRFRDVSFAARTQKTGERFLGFGAVPVDFDKDGWLDIFVGNGHVLGPEHIPNQLTNQILRNNEGGFDDVSGTAGSFFSIPTLSRGVATLDFDMDLDTDIVVNHLDRPISILRNDSVSPHRSVAFQLCSPQHLPLEGSRIEMQVAGKTQVLPFYAGGSYFTDSQREWIIGTGSAELVDQIVVYWRDGQVDTWRDLETGQRWQFRPGQKIRL